MKLLSFKKLLPKLYFPILLVYLECIFRAFIIQTPPLLTFVCQLGLSIAIGACLSVMCSLFTPKINGIVSVFFSTIFTLWFLIQVVYVSVFQTPLILSSIGGAGQILQFMDVILQTIWEQLLPILLILLFPILFHILFVIKKIHFEKLRFKYIWAYGISIFIPAVAVFLGLYIGGTDAGSNYSIYYSERPGTLILNRFGLLTCTKNDIKTLLFPQEVSIEDVVFEIVTETVEETSESTMESSSTEAEENVMVIEPNIMNFDFNALAQEENDSIYKTMNQYFSTITPTYTNEYTGIFEGYNLIFLSAESFSHYAIDPVITPTLYKLANEGFVFKNFYNPIWGVSTSDGEYVNCQGLIPKSGVWSMYKSGDNLLPFTMGNQFLNLGYTTYAYHNHDYDYYSRDVSHPNLGYTYKAYGQGLDVTYVWPESDLEMMELTIPDYINEDHFSIYYMTVSGHMPYSWGGNAMSGKHRDAVEHLDYSNNIKGYFACHIELDQALEYLLSQLEKAGKLENTVIVMGADHYPYGFTSNEFAELAGHPVEENFELYESSLIIWNAGMADEPVVVDKYCSSLDIIPTISNLFGLEYDSRLLMGQDILSDSAPLVIFANKSWITDRAMYDSRTGKATPLKEGDEISDEYVQSINQHVRNKFTFSTYILDYDYYRYLFSTK